MNHSHLIVGHITMQSVKIWVRAGDDVEFRAPANISLRVIDNTNRDNVHTDTMHLIDNSTYGCHVFNVEGINPLGEDRKSYSIDVTVNLENGETHELSGEFRTAPNPNSPFSFFLGSCHFSQGKDYTSPEFRDLKQWATIKKPAFMMHCGDQIYIDVFQGGRVARSELDYVDRHLDTWYANDTRDFLSSVPQYMILDDHEIYNNFKKPNSNHKRRNRTFEHAKNVYTFFQHAHNPDTPSHDQFHYHFEMGDAAYFVLDVRTEKTDEQMITEHQLNTFEQWVQGNTGKMKFIVTPVPMVTQLSAGQQKDKWSGKPYRDQRNKLFEILIKSGCKKTVFLTGDIHLACHAKISFSHLGSQWDFHELTSSPIKQLQFYIVNTRVKVIKDNVIDNTSIDFNYKLIHYMGKTKNSHGANSYKLQNNAMNISWNAAEGKLVYESLPLNTRELTEIFRGEIMF